MNSNKTDYIEREAHEWECELCGAKGEPQKYALDHLKEEHGWVEGEGFAESNHELTSDSEQ